MIVVLCNSLQLYQQAKPLVRTAMLLINCSLDVFNDHAFFQSAFLTEDSWYLFPLLPATNALICLSQERILANMEKVLSNCYSSADDLPHDDAEPKDALDGAEDGSEEWVQEVGCGSFCHCMTGLMRFLTIRNSTLPVNPVTSKGNWESVRIAVHCWSLRHPGKKTFALPVIYSEIHSPKLGSARIVAEKICGDPKSSTTCGRIARESSNRIFTSIDDVKLKIH